ncbi:MAG: MBL fold metallo-hydrolase [Halieaceae bacterium]|nr:MBL fold metallo-hydrolase [Halieaceae bacterium]MCP5203813.1 MBL fold metallo-hydrolase [Pseudomonadales bacterium]
MKRFQAIALAGLLLAAATINAETSESAPSVTTTPLEGPLYLLQGKGGNVVASVGADGILIIDDDYAEYSGAYHAALKSITGTAGLPHFVINTHWHLDHTGGNAYWGERGAVILAQENVYQRMSTRQEMKALNLVLEPSPPAALPVVTYGDSITLRFNDDRLEIRHFPTGHTDGDSVVFFTGQNVVHMGDHFFKDSFPFVDLGSGGNVLGYTENVAAILELVNDATVIVPGHGAIADRADLERYLDMLRSTTAQVQAALEQGLSVEQISEQGLGDEWRSWGQGFINEKAWISFIAGSL